MTVRYLDALLHSVALRLLVKKALSRPPYSLVAVNMSFGFSVGDFIALGTLAWNVYKSCKEAPESFGNISSEVLSLHVVLKEAEEVVFAAPVTSERQTRIKAVTDGCHCVVTDLQNLVQRYQGLDTQCRRTWDRLKWYSEDIAELRFRLIANATLLTALIR